MNIVMEKLEQRADGTLVVLKRTISYSKATRMVQALGAGWDGSTLAIFANRYCGCDRTEVLHDGRLVWKSPIDSTNVYLEAEV